MYAKPSSLLDTQDLSAQTASASATDYPFLLQEACTTSLDDAPRQVPGDKTITARIVPRLSGGFTPIIARFFSGYRETSVCFWLSWRPVAEHLHRVSRKHLGDVACRSCVGERFLVAIYLIRYLMR